VIGADSLHAASGAVRFAARSFSPAVAHEMTRIEAIEFMERWHEFYLLAGTAAVTLVGLLFVSLSFNLEVLIHSSHAHVLAHARSTLMTFSYLLVVSLGVLVPQMGPQLLGVLIFVATCIFGTSHVLSTRRRGDDSKFERGMRRRGRMFMIAYIIAAAASLTMILTGAPQLLFDVIPVVCMMLGTAMGMSWDLLVEVGKLKAAERARVARKDD